MLKNWFLILLVVGISVTFAGIKASKEPVVYRSTVTVLKVREKYQIADFGQAMGLSTHTGSSYDTIIALLGCRRMNRDIRQRFNPDGKPGIWWSIASYPISCGFAVDVKGPDPDLTEKIANFAIQNLDRINVELEISSEKPMVKVLDEALRGSPLPRDFLKNILAAGMFSFLACSCYIFLVDYLKTFKAGQ